jgi:hypothetical protein
MVYWEPDLRHDGPEITIVSGAPVHFEASWYFRQRNAWLT